MRRILLTLIFFNCLSTAVAARVRGLSRPEGPPLHSRQLNHKDSDDEAPRPPQPLPPTFSPTPEPTSSPSSSPTGFPSETPTKAPVETDAPVEGPIDGGLDSIERDVDGLCGSNDEFPTMEVTGKSMSIDYLYELLTNMEVADVTNSVAESIEEKLIETLMQSDCGRRRLAVDGVTGVFMGEQIILDEECVNYETHDVLGLTCYQVEGSATVYLDEDVAIDENEVERVSVAAVEDALSSDISTPEVREGVLGRTFVRSDTEFTFDSIDRGGDNGDAGESPVENQDPNGETGGGGRSAAGKFFLLVFILAIAATFIYCVVMRYWDSVVEREIFGPHKMPDDDDDDHDDDSAKEEPKAVISNDTMESYSLAEEMGTEAALNPEAVVRKVESPTSVDEDLQRTPYAMEKALYDRAMYGGMSRSRAPVAQVDEILEDLQDLDTVDDDYLMTVSEEQQDYDVILRIGNICRHPSPEKRVYSSNDTVDL